MRLKKISILFLMGAFSIYGCNLFDESDPYPYTVLTQGENSSYTIPIERVIQTELEWEQFWKSHGTFQQPPPELPQADFETSVVAAIFGGNHPSGGFSINIVSITQENSDVFIKYRIQGGGPPTVETQPFVILQLRKPAGKIEFQKL